MNPLEGFEFDRILSEDITTRTINLLGTLPAPDDPSKRLPAVLRLEKTALPKESASVLATQVLTDFSILDHNDVYSWITARTRLPAKDEATAIPADWKLYLICPASPQHISKYSEQARFFVRETPSLYETVTKKWIESIPPKRIEWVYNILEGKKEQESIVFDDKDPELGFVLLPDSKWDRQNPHSLYLQVIVRRRDVRSLRDLTSAHAQFLKHIRSTIKKVVPATFVYVKPEELNIFVHYQPSYYHFHIHVTHIRGPSTGQHHLLDDIIENIELSESYYQRRVLVFPLGVEHPLYKAMEEADPIREFLNS
ncbi:HIT-like protein [Gonapodya prolifera JEL478]|uniref:HIT-like protein n=1 Tax=Gonapodya prolifera (strain JEL478) TaxID=1344416 RepID=A0A139AXL5_GONPJ|nr:HIT-like protein [Gonapodya prolifera JEL478]|eukprot:KXS21460.1 HIT-like protein [Gonapodya prolifera JEL478]